MKASDVDKYTPGYKRPARFDDNINTVRLLDEGPHRVQINYKSGLTMTAMFNQFDITYNASRGRITRIEWVAVKSTDEAPNPIPMVLKTQDIESVWLIN